MYVSAKPLSVGTFAMYMIAKVPMVNHAVATASATRKVPASVMQDGSMLHALLKFVH